MALYDDRLEVISAGELHFGLSPEMLVQPHEYGIILFVLGWSLDDALKLIQSLTRKNFY